MRLLVLSLTCVENVYKIVYKKTRSFDHWIYDERLGSMRYEILYSSDGLSFHGLGVRRGLAEKIKQGIRGM